MAPDLLAHRQWFDRYLHQVQAGQVPGPLPPPLPGRVEESRVTCPCCGYPTLPGCGQYEICELCNWQDDGQDDEEADQVWGGPNHGYSLTAARINFQRHLIKYGPDRTDPRLGGPDTLAEQQHKRDLIGAWQAMVNETDPTQLTRLWAQVREMEAQLKQDLHQRFVRPRENDPERDQRGRR